MDIAEKIIRAKADYDEVYEAGKQAEYDAFWDKYQQNGQRDSYALAFAGIGWTNEMLKPKYDITPTASANYMFQASPFVGDLAQHLEDLGITFDTSKATTMSNFANSATKITRFGIIDCSNVTQGSAMFIYCGALETIDLWRVNENVNPGTFTSCRALKNLTIDGVIGQTGNFQYSPLTKDSITSIVTHLSDTVTDKSMTFSLAAVNKAFETSEGALDGSTSAEWQTLIATKPNWTISLV